MKQFILGILLGLILHKGLEETYEYHFISGFQTEICKTTYTNALNDPKEDAPLTRRFECAEEQMSGYKYISFILIRPHWSNLDKVRWYY